MDLAAAATAFVTIFFAELPDKTMLATIVLSARFGRPLPVWLGAASALATQVLIAVAFGRLLRLLPDRPVKFAVAALFAIGAIVLWRGHAHDGDELAASRPDVATVRRSWISVTATVYGVVFLAEWGDLTQLATASLATHRAPFPVFAGAAVAMATVAAIGTVAGRTLLRLVPARVLHRVAAVLFGALAVYFLYAAITTVDVSGSIRLG